MSGVYFTFMLFFFFFNDTATTEIYTLSLHDALPIWSTGAGALSSWRPPWLDSITPVAPLATARDASSAVITPLIESGPPHSAASHSTSFHVTDRSNCEPM